MEKLNLFFFVVVVFSRSKSFCNCVTRILCFWNSYWTNPKYQFVFSTSSKFAFYLNAQKVSETMKRLHSVCFSFNVFIFNINSVAGALPCARLVVVRATTVYHVDY